MNCDVNLYILATCFLCISLRATIDQQKAIGSSDKLCSVVSKGLQTNDYYYGHIHDSGSSRVNRIKCHEVKIEMSQ